MKFLIKHIEIVAILAFVALIIFVGAVGALISCGARWKNSGMQSSWGPLQGCQVETSPGRWILETRIMDIDLKQKPAKGNE